ncbi:DEHA2F09988p [Debaryomyces hansenii CBS767]|uniref:DNA topoisomerase I n=1 Tax=Debaryomyces hansenii (strain ATCC 36239 / CBS 767 / BCRC 21394 / JCM 1990 / NBRC 0083 / IGC 2968) TaxID=284592 RepID=Q6BLX2_DEBHA|nr:DEHA2F09988p [Debaryomyces hansenii CBS767]CAG89140.2 DEHA2F09988p [Debaryomyces hansenii CBS767]|eukprot:XP_460799.2 DEHA2F09988p [Debaryomyces hansenii CBS767]
MMSSSDDNVALSMIDGNIDQDDDMPLSQISSKSTDTTSVDSNSTEGQKSGSKRKASSPTGHKAKKVKRSKNTVKSESDEENTPLASTTAPPPKKTSKKKSESGTAKPRNGTKKSKGAKSTGSNKTDAVKKEDEVAKTEKDPSSTREDEEDEEKYKWWEAEDVDGEQKWESLEHNGVIFPPDYEPLPSHVKLYYDGKPVDLPLEAEEVAGFFGAMAETDHAKNPTFQKNFFEDFCKVLKDAGGCNVNIIDFHRMDFSKMHAHFEMLRDQKKLLSKDEKKAIKAEKDKFEEPYKTCLLNGHKEQVGNFRIEPPGLFRGRGAHPKTGKLKRRVMPEDVTLNLSEGCKIPEPPQGHKWAEVRHDNTVSWLAMWKENIADSFKYVRFAANSSIKGLSDFKKFETSRKLRYHIDEIRKDYTKMLKDPLMQNRQMATACYLIDIFALRAGGEKGDDEADTVGCCSLRYEHITLKPPNKVIFDFLGKDSIRFYQEVEVEKQVFKNLRIFKKPPKQPGDDLFDRISPPLLNKQFQNYMKGLTAKVFRTYNASKTMQDQLDLIPNEGTVAEKVVKFNAANRTVAILCNHQRTVSKTHGSSVQKIHDKLKELEWHKIRTKKMILQLEPNLKTKDPDYFEELDDLSKEDTEHIHRALIERAREAARKRFQRENDKLKIEDKPLLTEKDLEEKMEKVNELEKEYAEELKTGKPQIKKSVTVEKLKSQVDTLTNRILNTTFQLKDKEDNSEVSLGTSKMNYIDPRLTVMFSKKFNVPIEKLFTKTLRDKFNWAIESADENWKF